MYQYSLPFFINLFKAAISKSLKSDDIATWFDNKCRFFLDSGWMFYGIVPNEISREVPGFFFEGAYMRRGGKYELGQTKKDCLCVGNYVCTYNCLVFIITFFRFMISLGYLLVNKCGYENDMLCLSFMVLFKASSAIFAFISGYYKKSPKPITSICDNFLMA